MEGFPIVLRFPVHWGELDAYGHVNNARHFVWFESARMTYLREIGLAREHANDVGPILAATNASFLKPVGYPLDLAVGATVSRIGNTSLVMDYAVEDDATGVRLSTGSSVIVTVRYPSYEKVRVPDEIRERIRALQ